MLVSDAISTMIRQTQTIAEKALVSENSQNFEAFDRQIRELETVARETLQAKHLETCKTIIKKLLDNEKLTETERDIIELLIIGDAENYLKYENDLENWRNELSRLANEIGSIDTGNLDDDSLLHLQALCRDARGVLPDITFYYSEKERVERFKAARDSAVSRDDKRIIADVLTGILSSNKM